MHHCVPIGICKYMYNSPTDFFRMCAVQFISGEIDCPMCKSTRLSGGGASLHFPTRCCAFVPHYQLRSQTPITLYSLTANF